jgi:GNAT superfamily N-acetyltransferase
MPAINPASLVFSRLIASSDLSSFSCGQYRDLEDFLKHDARTYQENRIATTYLVYDNTTLVGFFSLAMGCVAADAVAGNAEQKGYLPKKYPALLIARLATCDGFQGQGIGGEMLKQIFAKAFLLCDEVGCRVVKVDAKNNLRTIRFYENHGGFIPIGKGDGDTVPMIVDINKMYKQ